MRAGRNFRCFLAAATLLAADSADAAISGLNLVANGLNGPIFVTAPPGDRNRLFIAERAGVIKILNLTTGVVEPTPFLTIPNVNQDGEGGFLGMTFHPDYANNGKFYVNVTIDNGGLIFQGAVSPFSTYVREYAVSTNPNIANTTFTPILSFIQPGNNHNAGWIGFSPNDGYLYIPTGDGGAGSGNDDGVGHTPGIGNSQDISDNLLGKVLRIDVNGDDFPADPERNYRIPPDNPFVGATTGDQEIWALGLRNPYRDSFDRLTGDLWLADVGEGNREEIDFLPANAPGGANFGWRLREGDIETPSGGVGGPPPPNYVPPVYAYTHPETVVPPVSPPEYSGRAVTGGYVYRGPDPSLQGKYFFHDPYSNNYWMADTSPFGNVTRINSLLVRDAGFGFFAASFGEDAVGNLYITYLNSGEVFRIATDQLLAGDYDADGDVDASDYGVWRSTFGSSIGNPAADGSGNGVVDASDYVVWRKNLGASVHTSAGASAASEVPEPSLTLFLFQWMALYAFSLLFFRRGR
jgi:glucose/arabinose dehydrogenase